VLRLLVTANVAPTSSILVPLVMEAIPSCIPLVLTRATRPNFPEDGILYKIHDIEGILNFLVVSHKALTSG
jgi:hypothetical protein